MIACPKGKAVVQLSQAGDASSVMQVDSFIKLKM